MSAANPSTPAPTNGAFVMAARPSEVEDELSALLPLLPLPVSDEDEEPLVLLAWSAALFVPFGPLFASRRFAQVTAAVASRSQ